MYIYRIKSQNTAQNHTTFSAFKLKFPARIYCGVRLTLMHVHIYSSPEVINFLAFQAYSDMHVISGGNHVCRVVIILVPCRYHINTIITQC